MPFSKNGLLLIFLLSYSFYCVSQEAVKPRPSPLSMVTARYKDTYLKIVYSQPHKKERELFGKLVPYGEVWRTGANEATELTITRDIKMNGFTLAAGTYSLFTIPNESKWTIIINSDLGQWGSYNYNSKNDVLRFDVPLQKQELSYEPFTITIDQKNEKAELFLLWDTLKISIPIQFNEPKP